jgi:hypothetical protein
MSDFTNANLSEGAIPPGALSLAARNVLRAQILAFRFTQNPMTARTDTGMCQQGGTLRQAWVMTEEALSAGESYTVDIVQAKTGVSILVAPVVVTLALAKELQLNIPIDPAKLVRARGDTFEFVRTYVAGGGPNAPPNTVCLEWA